MPQVSLPKKPTTKTKFSAMKEALAVLKKRDESKRNKTNGKSSLPAFNKR